jgi:hypothetical protein
LVGWFGREALLEASVDRCKGLEAWHGARLPAAISSALRIIISGVLGVWAGSNGLEGWDMKRVITPYLLENLYIFPGLDKTEPRRWPGVIASFTVFDVIEGLRLTT